MSLFQPTILSKYSKNLDNVEVSEAFDTYKRYFLNREIQENIRHCKEEQFQEGFLREIFVNVLGYTLNPLPNFNLITEQKNAANMKKADGAILVDGEVVGVIELKDGKTTDLGKVEEQAFNYKSQHKSAVYVVISNFEKLRFYIDNAVEYQEFNLFNLDENEFRILYLCLAYKNIERDIPKRIKEESVSNEDAITKALYRDYSVFKRELFDDILKNNACEDAETKVLLFKKSQKLLDRLLFIFFAEDSGLLMPNTMLRIISDWEKLRDLDAYTPLYERIKKYFGWLNDGYKGKDFEVFAYNGGLFKPDETLDNLVISDEVLKIHSRKLSEYDYATEVDVNILGHIFENSLNEIDDLQQQSTAKTPSKRKKDGVFYTPQYITKYIVENTVGRLCTDIKRQLGIVDEEYFSDKKRQSSTKKSLLEKLDAYREWLLGITICDPACGSGAFLNAALQFLMAEHALIDEMQAKVTGDSIVFPNIENVILENNLFGVDINEESVEIAKLSLWLRTAQPHRKLSSLNANIKCGNSLISNPEIAGSKAFDWQREFPQVFEKGGFDVVIGNPPYVRAELLPQPDIQYYSQNYKAFTPDGDLFSYFYEKGLNLIKENGLFGFISNTFDKTTAGESLRRYITDNAFIVNYIDFTEVQIFEGATTYPIILILSKQKTDATFTYVKIPHEMQGKVSIAEAPATNVAQDSLNAECWSFQSVEIASILKKIKQFPTVLEKYGKCYRGLLTGLNEAFFIRGKQKDEFINIDRKNAEIIEPIFEGKDLKKWFSQSVDKYLICTHNGYGKTQAIDIEDFPTIKKHLDGFEPQLSKRYDKGNTPYNLRNCAYQELFHKNKVVWGNLQNSNKFGYDTTGSIISAPACMLPTDEKALVCVLNSKIVWLFLTSICVVRSGGYIEVKPQYFEQIPVPDLGNASELEALSDLMLSLNRNLQEKRSRFLRRLQENFVNIKINNALERFDENGFPSFVAELKKQKVKLSLVEQDEWEEYFMKYKTECKEISEQIALTENDINNLVYELYGLREEEKKYFSKQIQQSKK